MAVLRRIAFTKSEPGCALPLGRVRGAHLRVVVAHIFIHFSGRQLAASRTAHALPAPQANDPRRISTAANLQPPPVHIENGSIDERLFPRHQEAKAPPGRGDLIFQYTGLSFPAPEKARFKYTLEGYDRNWVDAGARRTAYYSYISPGRYSVA